MRNNSLAVILCVLSAFLFGEVVTANEPLIEGPEKANAGTLVVMRLNTPDDVTEATWACAGNVTDDAWLAVEDGKVCVFACPVPAKYEFFVAVLIDGKVHLLRHVVLLEGSAPGPNPNPNPGPNPGPDPEPGPNPPLSKWTTLAKDMAMKLVQSPRQAEAVIVADAIEKAVSGEYDNLREAREAMRHETRIALGQSYVRWLGWSEEIGAALAKEQSTIKTTEDYAKIMKEVAAGLRTVTDDVVEKQNATSNNSTSRRRIVCTRNGCYYYTAP